MIQPYSRDACAPFRGDSTCQPIAWNGGPDVRQLAGAGIRFRFFLTRGDLFAFWVASTPAGPSSGYLAAGGPGATGMTDTVGQRV